MRAGTGHRGASVLSRSDGLQTLRDLTRAAPTRLLRVQQVPPVHKVFIGYKPGFLLQRIKTTLCDRLVDVDSSFSQKIPEISLANEKSKILAKHIGSTIFLTHKNNTQINDTQKNYLLHQDSVL